MTYDPFAPEVMADPAEAGRRLAGCPVHRFDGVEPPFWTLSHHRDVLSALRDPATFSSRFGQGMHYTEEHSMKSDAPVHTFFRKLVRKAFTPRAVAQMEPRIERIVAELLDGFAGRGEANLYQAFASPLPTIVIAEMLGVPARDTGRFKGWSDAWVAAMGSPDPEAFAPRIAEMREYLLEHVLRRQELEASGRGLPDDLISGLVLAEEDGERLTAEDVVNVVRQLLVGGNETTSSLITNALVRLTERPSLLQGMAGDPSLVERIVEESLRYDSPVLGLFRTTTRTVELHDSVIPEGAKVMLHYGAANRDPLVFSDPGRFDVDRDAQELRSHLAFGFGPHVCLGAALSRLEGRIALRQIAERLPGLVLAAPPERVTPFLLWGKRSLPARWTLGE